MALEQYLELNTGIKLERAYIRITEGILSLDKGLAFIVVETYADIEARLNKKEPVKRREYKCTMEGNQKQLNAIYELTVGNVEVGSNKSFSLHLGEDVEVEFIEGTHFTTDGTLKTLTNVIVEKLNKHNGFMYDFIAEYADEGKVKISINPEGVRSGSEGNGLTLTGEHPFKLNLIQEGQDEKVADFQKYFGIEIMNQEGKNVVLQAYEYIKDLPEYAGAVDV